MAKGSGFTLIELLVTIAIVAILAGAALPAFGEIYEQLRLSAYANAFMDAAGLARSEAVRRGEPVRLSANTDADGRSGFASGWCVHTGPRCAEDEAGAVILGRHEALRGTLAFSEPRTSFLEFDRFGTRRAPPSARAQGGVLIALFPERFDSCAAALERGRRLEIIGSGRVAVTRPSSIADCPQ